MGELRRQAANVIATSPGEVIAYEGSPLTRASLEAAGISVRTFGARELWANHRGPHCLTMPFVRG
jgi:arginine deiminase